MHVYLAQNTNIEDIYIYIIQWSKVKWIYFLLKKKENWKIGESTFLVPKIYHYIQMFNPSTQSKFNLLLELNMCVYIYINTIVVPRLREKLSSLSHIPKLFSIIRPKQNSFIMRDQNEFSGALKNRSLGMDKYLKLVKY